MSDIAESDLPDFDSPPVVETVLSVQFEKLPAMRSVHFGLFWQKVRGQFPNTEEHPALPSVIEQAKEPLAQPIQLHLESMLSSKPKRSWFVNSEGTELMQIQNDRFIKNWRGRHGEYPRYQKTIRPAFERDFQSFAMFLEEENLGEVKINQCEVTYVNHIIAGDGWTSWDDIENVFTFCKQPSAILYPGRAEDYAFRARFPIVGPKKEWIGRLHVDVQPATTIPDNKPMYAMNLTARGMCGTGIDFFDVGRRWVVKSFDSLTTEHMHKIWRKKVT